MTLRIDTLVLGPFETNCYLMRDDERCWVVDPGMWPGPLLDFLTAAGVGPETILLTHGHGDHIAGLAELVQHFPAATVLCPAGDADMLSDPQANLSAPFGMPITSPPPDKLIRPGDSLSLGETSWAVLDASGHTPGGVSFYCASEGVVVTGDALFAGSVGRTDVPGANSGRLMANIRQNLLSLPDDTRVLPGHGPETTIGRERRTNPFLSAG